MIQTGCDPFHSGIIRFGFGFGFFLKMDARENTPNLGVACGSYANVRIGS
mgnify:CR=1 FL=1